MIGLGMITLVFLAATPSSDDARTPMLETAETPQRVPATELDGDDHEGSGADDTSAPHPDGMTLLQLTPH